LAPGFTLTKPVLAAYSDPEERARKALAIPIGRPIYPDDLADTCLWVCSDAAGAITGLTIPVDGGKMAT
jgi:glucose 1-dehydrogenase